MKIFSIIFIGTLLVNGAIPCTAQTITGSWIKTEEVVIHQDGTTAQTFIKMTKLAPCLKTVVYTFSSDGKINEDASHCKPEFQKIASTSLRGAGWSMTGDKVTLTVADKTSPFSRMIFHVKKDGSDKMVWTFVYAENPGIPSLTKAKEMITTYERVN
ncbi:MAG: hypothetical protein BGO55_04605 [Sphingobacteriales bacterium 50-39]|nr:hypothetical protein [Sphingobacteriales bacterium]OJW55902.1 MAG: hypothetical protein BGO55_04605 [Sphingobacteriales bacterium 50-39]